LNNLLNIFLILMLFHLDMKDIDLHFLYNMLNNFLDILFQKKKKEIKCGYGSGYSI